MADGPRLSERQQMKILQQQEMLNSNWHDAPSSPTASYGQPGSGDGFIELTPVRVEELGASKFLVYWMEEGIDPSQFTKAEIQVLRRLTPGDFPHVPRLDDPVGALEYHGVHGDADMLDAADVTDAAPAADAPAVAEDTEASH